MLRLAIITLYVLAVTPAMGQTVVSDGPDVPELAIFDQIMIDFMNERGVPASQLAVIRQGKLIYSRAFSNNSEVPPDVETLFRIGSVSKPFTSTLIHRAYQDGYLSLDDTIDQYLDLTQLDGSPAADDRLATITIRNLLQHISGIGGIRELGYGPMSRDHVVAQLNGRGYPALKKDLLQYMNGVPLVNNPGENYSYSNFGYLVLGQILESATGMPYGAYADSVFNEIGLWRTRQARSQYASRYPNEVQYPLDKLRPTLLNNSGEMVPMVYGGLNWENRMGPGGWLSTATELTRWLVDLQSPRASGTVLNEETVEEMFALPENHPGDYTPGDYFYSSGWETWDWGNGTRSIRHSGSQVSTTSRVVSYANSLAYAVVFNKRYEAEGEGSRMVNEFTSVFTPELLDISQWPSHDLFDSLLTPTPADIDAIAAGSWFDASHNGEGFTVTFINAETAVVYWFTYDHEGNQRWYFGIASVEGTRLVVTDLLTSRGGRFGPAYDPDDVVFTSVGSLVLNFNAEGRAKADYLLDGESGALNLARLTQPFDSADPNTAGDWRNALVYDPSHDGEGFVVEALPNGQVVVYWFTYDSTGKQAWMIGTVNGDLDGGVTLPMDRPVGGNFGIGFDPENVQVPGNGVANMTLKCDGPMTVSFSGGNSKFPAVSLNLRLLGGYVPPSCN